ncbi:MAG: hypothetical protein MJZ05_01150 [Fibrobacter sp.]|nr:hypothetical protein [Fibrobacter sp.]
MKMTYICFLGLSILPIFSACSGNENSNVTAPQSGNTVCVENAKTTLNGVDYVCQNDQLVPVQNNQQNCSAGSTMIDAQGKSYVCRNNNWVLSNSQSSSSVFYQGAKSSSSVRSSSSSPKSSSSDSPYCYYQTKNYDCIPQSTVFSKVVNISGGSIYDESSNTLKDLRDNQVYKTVTIGNQTWMAENLKLDYDYGSAQSFCYDYIADSCKTLGHLYTYSAAIDSAGIYSKTTEGCGTGVAKCVVSGKDTANVRGICPEGWKIPTRDEWTTLILAAGGDVGANEKWTNGGIALKSKTGWDENGNGTDEYGFNVKPAGFKYSFNSYSSVSGGPFSYHGSSAVFWTTYRQTRTGTQTISFSAKDQSQSSTVYYVNYSFTENSQAASVRCIRDDTSGK